MTYLQPHEGVQGADRTDSLLSLEDTNIPTRDLLRGLARHLGTATLVGNPAPVVERMNERLRNPVSGDLVVEMSAMYGRGDSDRAIQGLGILVLERIEWWETDEKWAQSQAEDGFDLEEPRSTDHAWYIQYGSAARDICRWTNCTFTTIPWRDEQFAVPAGTRDGTAMVFTRDSLLSSLADSGIELNLKKD